MKDRLKEHRHGCARSAIWLAMCALVPAGFADAQSSGGGYTLRKHLIGSGVSAQGSPYQITATAGQASTGVATGGGYTLIAGFYQSRQSGLPDGIFCDGFENTGCISPPGALQ